MTLVLVAGAWHAAGQTTAIDFSSQGKLRSGTTLPVQCTVGQVFFKTNAPSGANLYACTALNTWSIMGLPVLGGDATGTQQSITVKGIQGRNVSAANPADQNVLRWNATAGQWEPGVAPATGTTAPPATCTAGGLYLRSDSGSNIHQLYVCTNTDTWTMANMGSGAAASRPANCVAGQTWLSTDTGVMTYCAVTGSPGTWSATLAGPQGPAGAAGNTILNGAGAPPGGTGANGDFYLNTAANCLYGPKASGAWPGSCTSLTGGSPNFTATSGNSTMQSALTATGVTESFVEPKTIAAGGNMQAGTVRSVWQSGLQNPADYGNMAPSRLDYYLLNGHNQTNDGDKKTISAEFLAYAWIDGGGQALGNNLTFTKNGPGDAIPAEYIVYCNSFANAWGDEGCEAGHFDIFGPSQLYVTTVSAPSVVTAGSTTLTGPITKNQGGPTTFGVASTAGFSAGQWITICANPCTFLGTDTNVDTVEITAVGAGTLTAWLMANHDGTDVVTPAPRVTLANMDPQRLGQWQVWVNHSAPTYSAGTATFSPDDKTVTLSGGSFATATTTVGGNANAPGCIRVPADDNTSSPWGAGAAALQHWYPIQSASGSTATLTFAWQGRTGSGISYVIARCDEVGALEPSMGTTSETIAHVVMRNNLAWTSGDSVEQTVTPAGAASRGLTSLFQWNDAQGPHPDLYVATTFGQSYANYAFHTTSGNWTGVGPQFNEIILSEATSRNGAIIINGQDASGVAMQLKTTTAGAGDPKCIRWLGTGFDESYVCGGETGIGARIYSGAHRLTLGQQPGTAAAGTFDYSALGSSGTAVWYLPAQSGPIAMANPGGLTVTTPASTSTNNALTLGTFTNAPGYNGDYEVYVSTGCFNRTYRFASSLNTAQNSPGSYVQLVPLNDFPANPQCGAGDFAVDVWENGNSTSFRVRTTVAGSVAAFVYINQIEGIYNGVFSTWTPCASSCTATVSAPTAIQPTTVISQHDNKLDIVNATGFAARIDPTALTAARTITLPNSNTFLPYVGTTGPTCSSTGDIGKFWFDTTTTTTVRKTCNNVAGTLTWVTF